jgi:hypothetical protein
METMNTDTPETDGEWNRLACQDHPEFERNLADFARKLERERDDSRKWSSTLADAGDEIRAQLREEQQLHVQTLNERDALAAWKEARSESALP